MPCVTAHAMTSCAHYEAHARRHACRPMPEITYGHDIRESQTIFIKINCLTFKCPKYIICKPECAEKVSHCHAHREQGRFQ